MRAYMRYGPQRVKSGFRITNFYSPFAANIVWIARSVAEIRLFLYRFDGYIAIMKRQFLRAKYVDRNVSAHASVYCTIAPWCVLAIVRAAVPALLAGENARSRGQDGSVNTHRRM